MSSAFTQFKRLALVNALRSCQIFTGLPASDLETLADLAVTKTLEKGEYLFREGDPSTGFYIVQRGAINVHRVNPLGKEQVIHVFRVGESFAEATLATDRGYPGDARAVSPSQVLMVQKDGFIALLKRRPDLALRMLASMSAHLRVLVGQLEDLTTKDVETRLANWLIKMCPDPQGTKPVPIQLTVTKRVLALELGTTSETFSRTLAKFRSHGLVLVKDHTITVQSPARLWEFLQQHVAGIAHRD